MDCQSAYQVTMDHNLYDRNSRTFLGNSTYFTEKLLHRKPTVNRSLLKRIKIAQIEKKDLKEELASYLMMYRTNTHSTTGVSPSKRLFHRKLRKSLPGIEDFSSWTEDQDIRDHDNKLKEKGKMYIDKKEEQKKLI